MAAVTICSDFGAQKIKSDTVPTVSPSISHEVMGPDAMIFVFWMLSFKPTFSLYTFTFIKRLFSSFSLSAVRVVSSAYLRLLIFLPAILIPACASSSPDSILRSKDITLPTKVRLVKAMVFLWSCMDVRVGLWRRLSTEELMLLNCGVGEDSWESLGLQGDPTSPFWWRSALGVLWKEWC